MSSNSLLRRRTAQFGLLSNYNLPGSTVLADPLSGRPDQELKNKYVVFSNLKRDLEVDPTDPFRDADHVRLLTEVDEVAYLKSLAERGFSNELDSETVKPYAPGYELLEQPRREGEERRSLPTLPFNLLLLRKRYHKRGRRLFLQFNKLESNFGPLAPRVEREKAVDPADYVSWTAPSPEYLSSLAAGEIQNSNFFRLNFQRPNYEALAGGFNAVFGRYSLPSRHLFRSRRRVVPLLLSSSVKKDRPRGPEKFEQFTSYTSRLRALGGSTWTDAAGQLKLWRWSVRLNTQFPQTKLNTFLHRRVFFRAISPVAALVARKQLVLVERFSRRRRREHALRLLPLVRTGFHRPVGKMLLSVYQSFLAVRKMQNSVSRILSVLLANWSVISKASFPHTTTRRFLRQVVLGAMGRLQMTVRALEPFRVYLARAATLRSFSSPTVLPRVFGSRREKYAGSRVLKLLPRVRFGSAQTLAQRAQAFKQRKILRRKQVDIKRSAGSALSFSGRLGKRVRALPVRLVRKFGLKPKFSLARKIRRARKVREIGKMASFSRNTKPTRSGKVSVTSRNTKPASVGKLPKSAPRTSRVLLRRPVPAYDASMLAFVYALRNDLGGLVGWLRDFQRDYLGQLLSVDERVSVNDISDLAPNFFELDQDKGFADLPELGLPYFVDAQDYIIPEDFVVYTNTEEQALRSFQPIAVRAGKVQKHLDARYGRVIAFQSSLTVPQGFLRHRRRLRAILRQRWLTRRLRRIA